MGYTEIPEHRKGDVMWMVEGSDELPLFFEKYGKPDFTLVFFDLSHSNVRLRIHDVPVDEYATVAASVCAIDGVGPLRWIKTDSLYCEYVVGINLDGCSLREDYAWRDGALISC